MEITYYAGGTSFYLLIMLTIIVQYFIRPNNTKTKKKCVFNSKNKNIIMRTKDIFIV